MMTSNQVQEQNAEILQQVEQILKAQKRGVLQIKTVHKKLTSKIDLQGFQELLKKSEVYKNNINDTNITNPFKQAAAPKTSKTNPLASMQMTSRVQNTLSIHRDQTQQYTQILTEQASNLPNTIIRNEDVLSYKTEKFECPQGVKSIDSLLQLYCSVLCIQDANDLLTADMEFCQQQLVGTDVNLQKIAFFVEDPDLNDDHSQYRTNIVFFLISLCLNFCEQQQTSQEFRKQVYKSNLKKMITLVKTDNKPTYLDESSEYASVLSLLKQLNQ